MSDEIKNKILDLYILKFCNGISKETILQKLNEEGLNDEEKFLLLAANFITKTTSDEHQELERIMRDELDKTYYDLRAFLEKYNISKIDKMLEKSGITQISQGSQNELTYPNLIYIKENPTEGFNFPFMIYFPTNPNLDEPNTLILHSCNQPGGVVDKNNALDVARTNQLDLSSLHFKIANATGNPIIMPIIPRYRGYNPQFTFLGDESCEIDFFDSEQEKLEEKYKLGAPEREEVLKRCEGIIHQQICMCDYATKYLNSLGHSFDGKIIVEGHSAGSKNAVSIVNAYPEKVAGFILGGTTGLAILNKNVECMGYMYDGIKDNNNPFVVDNNGKSMNKENFTDSMAEEVIIPRMKELGTNIGDDDFAIKSIKKFNEDSLNDSRFTHELINDYGHDAIKSQIVVDNAIRLVSEINKNRKLNIPKY